MDILDIHTHHRSLCGILNTSPISFWPAENQYYSVGIHPRQVIKNDDCEWQVLRQAAAHAQVLAIGEAGLDKMAPVDMLLQEEVFVLHTDLAERVKKPLIIHAVRSSNEIVRLKKKLSPSVPWIVHGFRGNGQLASELVRHGFYLSFGEKYQPDALKAIPLERLFLETDESREEITTLYHRAAEYLSVPCRQLRERIGQNIKDVFFSS